MPSQGRVSCMDYSFAHASVDFAGAAAAVARLGFEAIDVSVRWRFPLTAPSVVREAPLRVADERARVANGLGLRVADVFAIFDDDPADPRSEQLQLDESRRDFEAVLAFASRLGVPGLTILGPTDRKSVV